LYNFAKDNKSLKATHSFQNQPKPDQVLMKAL
jgi:hypothetical protein